MLIDTRPETELHRSIASTENSRFHCNTLTKCPIDFEVLPLYSLVSGERRHMANFGRFSRPVFQRVACTTFQTYILNSQ